MHQAQGLSWHLLTQAAFLPCPVACTQKFVEFLDHNRLLGSGPQVFEFSLSQIWRVSAPPNELVLWCWSGPHSRMIPNECWLPVGFVEGHWKKFPFPRYPSEGVAWSGQAFFFVPFSPNLLTPGWSFLVPTFAPDFEVDKTQSNPLLPLVASLGWRRKIQSL